jgi:hypothetical protein
MNISRFAAGLGALAMAGATGFAAAPKAPPAPPYTLGRVVVEVRHTVTYDPTLPAYVDRTVDCPAGKVVVSGGWRLDTDPGMQDEFVGVQLGSWPVDENTWAFRNSGYQYSPPLPLTLYVVCVNP